MIHLSDGKARSIKHIASALYWSPEGKPITAKEFIERLFGEIPRFFSDEDQLRHIWSDPSTREKLQEDLSEAGYGEEQLDSMKNSSMPKTATSTTYWLTSPTPPKPTPAQNGTQRQTRHSQGLQQLQTAGIYRFCVA
ncbi:type I restriction-modification enzyme R subunit C-terminal domain-containing protein [Halopseudomonas pachastrellae]|nr:type I restriction-modification enzyme R subunit C-terminal domain-containing protein [Halopseudomonas pachastrellae]